MSFLIRENDGTSENVESQARCVHEALYSGTKSSLIALGVSAAVVLGACKAFPSVARSLSVSGKTALIVTPFFGFFFLDSELTMSRCTRRERLLAAGLLKASSEAQK